MKVGTLGAILPEIATCLLVATFQNFPYVAFTMQYSSDFYCALIYKPIND